MLLCLGRQNLAKLQRHVGKQAKYSPVLSCKASNDKPLCSLMALTRMTLPHKSIYFKQESSGCGTVFWFPLNDLFTQDLFHMRWPCVSAQRTVKNHQNGDFICILFPMHSSPCDRQIASRPGVGLG